MSQNREELDIVIPIFNEADSLDELITELMKVESQIGIRPRIFLVDDGSRDESWEKMESYAGTSNEISIVAVKLNRNYGQMTAFDCGLELTSADFVITMDGDLQHPPSFLGQLWEKRSASHIVAARQVRRKDSINKRVLSRAFYRLISQLTGIHFKSNVSDFRIIPRVLLLQLLEVNDSPRIMRFLIPKLGLKQIYLDYFPSSRAHGKSKYTLKKMLGLATYSIITTTNKLLRLSLLTSLFYAIFTTAVFIYGLAVMLSGNGIPGYLSILLTLSVSFTGMFLILGIFGLYLEKVLDSVGRIKNNNASKISKVLGDIES